METQLARAVDLIMARAKRIYTLIIKVNVARVPTAFLVLPNFHSCFYNSIETRYMFSITLLFGS